MCGSIILSLRIIDLKMVSKGLLSQVDLMGAQTFCIYKLSEVVMVRENENLVFVAFQIVVPSLVSFNISQ